MLRGHRTYQNLFEVEKPLQEAAKRMGRSAVLHQKRNELLIHRYYFYVKIEGKQYLKTLETLEEELFIAQQTIVNQVSDNIKLLKELNTVKPSAAYFRKKYPYLVW